jgi:hypothetical protein
MLQAVFEKPNSFLRPLKKKGFKEERVTTMGRYDLGTSHDPGIQQEPHLFLLPALGGQCRKVMRADRRLTGGRHDASPHVTGRHVDEVGVAGETAVAIDVLARGSPMVTTTSGRRAPREHRLRAHRRVLETVAQGAQLAVVRWWRLRACLKSLAMSVFDEGAVPFSSIPAPEIP